MKNEYWNAFVQGFKDAIKDGCHIGVITVGGLLIAILLIAISGIVHAQEVEAPADEPVFTTVPVPQEPQPTVQAAPVTQPLTPLPFRTVAKYVFVIDQEGNVLAANNSTEVVSIASITKLMTAVVLLDANLDMEEPLTITDAEVQATKLRGKNTKNRLVVGTTLSRAEMLHLTLMNSNNRAAALLARTYPGGTQAFVNAMNAKAEALGLDNTHYVDPTGLYSDNVSTAEELAKLVRHASDYAMIRDFSTSTSFELTTYNRKHHAKVVEFGTTNRLVRRNDWHIFLQKTGYIKDAGRCVVMMAETGAKKVIIVLLNATSSTARAADATNIKTWLETGEVPAVKQVREPKRKVRRHRTRSAN